MRERGREEERTRVPEFYRSVNRTGSHQEERGGEGGRESEREFLDFTVPSTAQDHTRKRE